MQQGAVIVDMAGQIQYANVGMALVVGVPVSEVAGRSFEAFLAKWEVERFRCLLNSAQVRRSRHEFTLVVGTESRPVHCLVMAQSVQGSGADLISLLVTDLTEHEQLERVQERNNELELAGKRKDEFLAILGHELRNPLAAIRSSVDLMKGPGQRDLTLAIGVIDRQTRHLSRLVDDLLDVSRITMGRVNIIKRRLDLTEVLERTVADLVMQLPEMPSLRVVAEPKLWVQGDSTRMEQILSNIISNAIKFTPVLGTILIDAHRCGDTVELVISDSGVGMDADLISRIFEPLSQGDQPLDRSDGGLGIGLSLCQKLVRLHGGEIVAMSDGVGRGSTFRVTFPMDDSKLEAAEEIGTGTIVAAEGPGVEDKHRTPKVLVVDDNIDSASLMTLLLKGDGFEVETVHDGHTAVSTALSEHPDVILLDIGLPGMDGYQVAETVRKSEGGARCLIIGISGYGEDSARTRSKLAGFDYHLVKPVEFDEVLRVLEQLR
jgi:signal transduction histidine kinase